MHVMTPPKTQLATRCLTSSPQTKLHSSPNWKPWLRKKQNLAVHRMEFSPINIKDQFTRGLSNTILQTDILTKANVLTSIDNIIAHAEAFEGAVRDRSKLNDSGDDAHAARISEYKRNNSRTLSTNSHRKPNSCNGCGSSSHGYLGSKDRSSKCPAWGKVCHNCGIANHFAGVCKRPLKEPNRLAKETVSEFHLCSCGHPKSEAIMDVKLLAHVKYDANRDHFTSPNQSSVDEIPAVLTVKSNNSLSHAPTPMTVFPDSGASICLAGSKHLPALGITPQQLIPCSKRISAVGGSILPCQGWKPVEFNIQADTRSHHEAAIIHLPQSRQNIVQ